MKKFHFPLERVREWRRTQVAIETAKLEALFAERGRIEQRMAAIEREYAASAATVLRGSTADAVALQSLDSYRSFVIRHQVNLRAERVACDDRIAAQRAQLLEAQRKVRLLDKLEERKQRVWKASFERELEEQSAEAYRAANSPSSAVRATRARW